jgi:hypothetical protein
LRACELVLHGAKCCLGGNKVEFLGVTVTGDGVAHTQGRKEALAKMTVPINKPQLRCFSALQTFLGAM